MKYLLPLLLIFIPAAELTQDTLTIKDIPSAERILGLQFTPAERDLLFNKIKDNERD